MKSGRTPRTMGEQIFLNTKCTYISVRLGRISKQASVCEIIETEALVLDEIANIIKR